MLKLCRRWASVTTDLSDHCFGYNSECKTREAVGRIIRASGLQGGEELGQTYWEEESIHGRSTQLLGPCTVLGAVMPL